MDTRKTCGFVPPTPGYAPCKRDANHDGPCAHEFAEQVDADRFHRREAESALYKELGFSFLAQNSALTVTIFEPKFRVASLHQLDRKWDVVYLMDKAWDMLVSQRATIATLTRERDEAWGQREKVAEDPNITPLCADHAELWYTQRNTIKAECVFCSFAYVVSAANELLSEGHCNKPECDCRASRLRIAIAALSHTPEGGGQ